MSDSELIQIKDFTFKGVMILKLMCYFNRLDMHDVVYTDILPDYIIDTIFNKRNYSRVFKNILNHMINSNLYNMTEIKNDIQKNYFTYYNTDVLLTHYGNQYMLTKEDIMNILSDLVRSLLQHKTLLTNPVFLNNKIINIEFGNDLSTLIISKYTGTHNQGFDLQYYNFERHCDRDISINFFDKIIVTTSLSVIIMLRTIQVESIIKQNLKP